METKRPSVVTLVPPSGSGRAGLVSDIALVELLAIRSCADEYVRAKVRVKGGDLAGKLFLTRQPKSEEAYSDKDFSQDEIKAMKERDRERDSKLSPRASVVASIEGGRMLMIEPLLLVDPGPYDRFKPFKSSRPPKPQK